MELSNIFLSEKELGVLFSSILIIFSLAHLFGFLFSQINLPRVVGEIFSGILLGPSCLGYIFPETYNSLFNFFPEQGKIFSFLYWSGLLLLMLSAGFKISKTSNLKDNRMVINLTIFATLFPILGGFIYCLIYDFGPFKGELGTDVSISIIVCLAIAVTSIPVISKIFLDLGIINSRFAKIVLATAVFQDLILWAALGVAIKSSQAGNENIFTTAFITVAFLFFSLLIGPRLVNYPSQKLNPFLESSHMVYILLIFFSMTIISNILGINIAFGALMAGIIIGTLSNEEYQKARNSLSDFSLSFFIPIYFSIIGLKINLPSYFDISLFCSFLIVSSFLEIGSVFIGLQLLRKPWLTSLNFGFAMNTRGGPGIVLASTAYEFSIINETFFVVLVLVAIVTSLISGAWFKYILNKGWSLCEI